jgi:hypothetical protein
MFPRLFADMFDRKKQSPQNPPPASEKWPLFFYALNGLSAMLSVITAMTRRKK